MYLNNYSNTVREKTIKHLGQICKGPTISRKEIEKLKFTLNSIYEVDNAQNILKTLSGDTRLKILIILHQINELCVCDMADILGTTVSAISHQLKKLKEFDFVQARRDTQTIYYSLADKEKINSFLKILDLV
jgi:DNA-binding transcriptional ArsR family regulator